MLVNNTYKCKNDTIALFYAVYFPLRDGCKKGKGRGGGGRTKYYGEKGKGSLLNLLLVTVKNKSISLL